MKALARLLKAAAATDASERSGQQKVPLAPKFVMGGSRCTMLAFVVLSLLSCAHFVLAAPVAGAPPVDNAGVASIVMAIALAATATATSVISAVQVGVVTDVVEREPKKRHEKYSALCRRNSVVLGSYVSLWDALYKDKQSWYAPTVTLRPREFKRIGSLGGSKSCCPWHRKAFA
eukprot:Nk52_evm38s1073 gene=Nk52_evmTU38s1073